MSNAVARMNVNRVKSGIVSIATNMSTRPPCRLNQTYQVPLPVIFLKCIVYKPPGTSKSFVLQNVLRVKVV